MFFKWKTSNIKRAIKNSFKIKLPIICYRMTICESSYRFKKKDISHPIGIFNIHYDENLSMNLFSGQRCLNKTLQIGARGSAIAS